ncbi:MAG: hypothetical protein OXU61_12410 [Gammaproteobacteria bacterium]|nr:hypothetical protein [Gammaproteobacteria bacterium]
MKGVRRLPRQITFSIATAKPRQPCPLAYRLCKRLPFVALALLSPLSLALAETAGPPPQLLLPSWLDTSLPPPILAEARRATVAPSPSAPGLGTLGLGLESGGGGANVAKALTQGRRTLPAARTEPGNPGSPNIVAEGALLAAEVPEEPERAQDPLGQFAEPSIVEAPRHQFSLYQETQYYDWKNKNDSSNRGYQLINSLTAAYAISNFDFGYRQAHVVSRNKTPGAEGRVTTFSDAALSAAYTFREWQWPVRIVLDYNLPSGKATLNRRENNVLVDSYLTQLSQFGEGHNVTPGINVTRALNDRNVVGAGIGYSFKGEFDPNSEGVNDEIDPGDELNVTAQWQHRRRNWTAIGGFIFTDFARTQRNGMDFFQKGNRRNYNLTGIWALPGRVLQGQQLHANLRLTQQQSDKNFSGFSRELEREAFNVNGDTRYFSLSWSKALRQRHNFRLVFDHLEAMKNEYPEDTINFDAGRTRLGYGISYSYAFGQRGSLSLKARRYKVQNKAELEGQNDLNYTGTNVSMNLNLQF